MDIEERKGMLAMEMKERETQLELQRMAQCMAVMSTFISQMQSK